MEKRYQEAGQEFAQAHGVAIGKAHGDLDPFPALAGDGLGLRFELLAHQPFEQHGVVQPATVVLLLVDQVLDVRQQARFRLFEEQMERRKVDLLMRARQRVYAQHGVRPHRRVGIVGTIGADQQGRWRVKVYPIKLWFLYG